MAANGSSAVRSMLYAAWGDFRRRPLMWLLLSASVIPLVFVNDFCLAGMAVTGSTQAVSMVLSIAGYAVCFALVFLFWCMAVLLYDDHVYGESVRPYGAAFRGISRLGRPALWSGLVYGLGSVFAAQIANIAVGLLLSFVASGQAGGAGRQALLYVSFYLSYVVADLILVFIVMVPQMLALEGGTRVDEVLRASYMVVRERYRDAALLLIVPEVVVRTLYIALLFTATRISARYLVFVFFLSVMSLLEGGRIGFVAAAFNRFYYRVLEEEARKKKKGKKQAAGGQARKQPPKEQPRKKQPSGKRPPAKPSGRKK